MMMMPAPKRKIAQPNIKPEPAQRKEVSGKTRFLEFPWGSKVGWPLREIGVHIAGIDLLQDTYLAGTPASVTYLLYFILSGKVECDTGTGFFPLQKGEWILCPVGTPHWIRLAKGNAEALWVHLLDIPRWRFLSDQGAGIHSVYNTKILESSLIGAIAEAASSEYAAFENAISYASIFRVQLIREIDHACNTKRDPMVPLLSGLWSKVNSRLDEEWDVERLASEIHVSRSKLYEYAGKIHKVKPMGMVTRLRIEQAKDLLLHTDGTLENIATAIGYKTPYAFSEAFFRETGQRPGRYRKRN